MYKVKMDGEYLYHPWDASRSISSGQLTLELGKNGTFDCDIPIENSLYNAMLQRKSIVEVIRFRMEQNRIIDENCIYRGVYINDTDGLNMQREAETDGDMVFLNESYQRPRSRTTTPQEEFSMLIAAHNAQMEEFKRFTVGTIQISGEAVGRNITGYQSTKEAIEELQEAYGGYIRTRSENGQIYIDWLSDYSHQSNQDIRYGKNVIDITKYLKAEDLATRVIPLGKSVDGVPLTIKSVNDGLDYLQDEEAVRQFGIIEKTVEFTDIEDPQELKQAGADWLISNKGAMLTIEVTAADLAEVDINIEFLNIGDRVRCVARQYGIDAVLQITKMSLNILKVSSSKVTLGATMQTFTQRQGGIIPAVNQAVQVSQSASQTAQEAIKIAESGGGSILAAYPIGSIYISIKNIDPATYFGGTWIAWGKGRVPVGVDPDQEEFNKVEKTGGSKYTEKHNHTENDQIWADSNPQIEGDHYVQRTGIGEKMTSSTQDGGMRETLYTGYAGTGDAGNLQPYITCYMWLRTE